MKGSLKHILALTLGDGGIFKNTHHTNYRLIIHHGINQAEYAEWKAKLIQQYIHPQVQVSYKMKQEFPSIMLRTPSHHKYTSAHKMFYQDGCKHFNQAVLDKLDTIAQLALAIWIMDDGCVKLRTHKSGFKVYKEFYLYTFCSGEDAQRIQTWIQKHTGVLLRIKNAQVMSNRHNKMQWILYNSRALEILQLLEFVEPIIREIPSMHYKINYNVFYRTQEKKNLEADRKERGVLWCSGCEQEKSTGDFQLLGSIPRGYQYHCRLCRSAIA